MIDPTMRLDLRDIDAGFDSMKRQARDLRRVWRKFQPLAKRDQQETKRLAEGPDGQKWAPLSPATLRKRLQTRRASARRRRRRIPQRVTKKPLGRLPTQAAFRFNATKFRSQSRVAWSGAHQEGAIVGRGSKLPQRVHVYFSDESLDRLQDMLAKHLTRLW